MYRWIGSAMSPRPSYVSAAPFMPTRVPRSARGRAIERVAIHRAHGDDALVAAAAHGHLDGVAGLSAPQSLVELLLRGLAHAVHADDAVAAAKAGRARGPGVVEAVDDDAVGAARRVQPEPRPRPPARHAPGRDQLVLHGHERLDGDGQVDVRRVPQPQRDDADEAAAVVDQRAAAPRRERGPP